MLVRAVVTQYNWEDREAIAERMRLLGLTEHTQIEQRGIIGDWIPDPEPASYLINVKSLVMCFQCSAGFGTGRQIAAHVEVS